METRRHILEEIAGGRPLPHLKDPAPEVRRLAAAACAGLGLAALEPLAGLAATDPDAEVRAEAVEVLGGLGPAAYPAIRAATGDPAARVVEAATTALGEIGDPGAVPWLMETAAGHDEPAVREAAVAALGAIGDVLALPTLLSAAATGKPRVRRRAIVALTAFEGPGVEAAFTAARLDRNPMVREAAEMVLGRAAPEPADEE